MKIQIKISDVRRLLKILSEPYVMYGRMGYQAVIDVEDVHKGEKGYLIISAISLGEPLNQMSIETGGKLKGLSISIQKENASRMSRYLVSLLES